MCLALCIGIGIGADGLKIRSSGAR